MSLVASNFTDTENDYAGPQTAISATWAQATAAGNCGVLVLLVNEFPDGVVDAGEPDLSGQGWTRVTAADADGLRLVTLTYIKPDLSAGESAVSITLPTPDAGGHNMIAWLAELDEIATSPVDQATATANSDLSTTPTTGTTGTTTQAGETIIAVIGQQFVPSATLSGVDAAYTPVGELLGIGSSEAGLGASIFMRQVTATDTYVVSGTFSAGRRHSSNIVTLKEAASDTTDPTVTIDQIHGTGPVDDVHGAAGYDPATDLLTVTGTAADEGGSGLDTVEVRVDGGSWVAATGTATWSIDLDVSGWAAGTHTVEARATDGAANVSTIASETVWHSPDGLYGAASTAGQHLVPVTLEGWTAA